MCGKKCQSRRMSASFLVSWISNECHLEPDPHTVFSTRALPMTPFLSPHVRRRRFTFSSLGCCRRAAHCHAPRGRSFTRSTGRQHSGSGTIAERSHARASIQRERCRRRAGENDPQTGSYHHPTVEFRESTVSDALKYLERQSNQWDTSEPEAQKRGVKFVLINPASLPFGDARLTISLNNIPLIEAINYVTSLANLKYRIRPDHVEIAGSWPDADVLKVRVTPAFTKIIPRSKGIKEFLKENAIPFPKEHPPCTFERIRNSLFETRQRITIAWLL
jgi:hypothetical protein